VVNCTLCLKNVSPLTCYNIDTHNPITTIFGRSVTKKVGNQMMLCFPMPHLSSGSALYTLRNRNCIFSLKQRTYKTFKLSPGCSWITLHSQSDRLYASDNYLEREHIILVSVTHTLYVYQVCHGVSRYVEDGSCSSSSLDWKSMDSI